MAQSCVSQRLYTERVRSKEQMTIRGLHEMAQFSGVKPQR